MCKVALLSFVCGHSVVIKFEICELGPCPRLLAKSSNIQSPSVPCIECQKTLDPSAETRYTLTRRSTYSTTRNGGPPPLRRWPSLPFLGRHQIAGGQDHSVPLHMTNNDAFSSDTSKIPYLNFSCQHERQLSYVDLSRTIPRQKHACMDCQFAALRAQIDREVIEEAERLWPKVRKDRKQKGRPRKDWMTAEAYNTFIAEERGDGRQLALMVERKWSQDLKSFGVLGGLSPALSSSSQTVSPVTITPDSASG